MGSHFGVRLVYLSLALTIIQGIHAIEYTVTCFAGGKGGKRFKEEIGDDVAISTMERATNFVWEEVLEQLSPSERKDVQQINLIIDVQQTTDSTRYKNDDHTYSIHLNAAFIRNCPEGGLKRRITRLIYFHIASILQWTTDDKMIMKSIAYFAILKANYQSSKWAHFGEGDKWNSSRAVTAQFLVYCNNRKSGFVAFLNEKMHGSSFSISYFQEFFKESVDVLWSDYKDKYSGQA